MEVPPTALASLQRLANFNYNIAINVARREAKYTIEKPMANRQFK